MQERTSNPYLLLAAEGNPCAFCGSPSVTSTLLPGTETQNTTVTLDSLLCFVTLGIVSKCSRGGSTSGLGEEWGCTAIAVHPHSSPSPDVDPPLLHLDTIPKVTKHRRESSVTVVFWVSVPGSNVDVTLGLPQNAHGFPSAARRR